MKLLLQCLVKGQEATSASVCASLLYVSEKF